VDAFGEYERLIIKARTKSALAVKKSRSEKTGGLVPYGFMLGEGRPGPHGTIVKTLVACPEEQAIIAEIKQLRAQGQTLQVIASELNAKGIQRRGGKWDHTVLSRLIKNAA
jgi:DNA invertase Pin-like site-specific DNA recombinase